VCKNVLKKTHVISFLFCASVRLLAKTSTRSKNIGHKILLIAEACNSSIHNRLLIIIAGIDVNSVNHIYIILIILSTLKSFKLYNGAMRKQLSHKTCDFFFPSLSKFRSCQRKRETKNDTFIIELIQH